jgi:hypothetical protein
MNLKIRCIKMFPTQKKNDLKKMPWFLSFITHFKLKYSNLHMNFWTNHMSNDNFKINYQ